MGDLMGLEGIIRYGGLHVLRVLGAIWFLPIFNPGPGSRLMRLGLGLTLGVGVAVARFGAHYEDPGSEPLVLAVLAGKELVFGFLLGWLAGMALEAVKIAGSLISIEMGMHMANQIDPNTSTNMPVIGFFFQNMAMVFFFAAGGHRIVLQAFVRSFDMQPPGVTPDVDVLLPSLLSFASLVMTAAIKIAGPVFLLLIIVSVCVGFLAKMAPNLHILEASFPIRILAGFILLVIFMPGMMGAFDAALNDVGAGLLLLIEGGG